MNNRDSSVPTSEASVEAEIQAKGLTAPRITPDHIDRQIVRADYFVPGDVIAMQVAAHGLNVPSVPAGLACLTICVLTLANGFTVTGESACASPENFDRELGRKIAHRNARDKIWALEGYLLRTYLAGTDISFRKPMSQSAPDPMGGNGSPISGDRQFGAMEG